MDQLAAQEGQRRRCGAPCFWQDMNPDEVQQETKRLAREGAVAVLQEIGFYDEKGRVDRRAVSDFTSLRAMLRDWRDFKHTTWQAIVKWVLWIALGLLAIKLGVADYLKIGRG